jgi:hypothetical protein
MILSAPGRRLGSGWWLFRVRTLEKRRVWIRSRSVHGPKHFPVFFRGVFLFCRALEVRALPAPSLSPTQQITQHPLPCPSFSSFLFFP